MLYKDRNLVHIGNSWTWTTFWLCSLVWIRCWRLLHAEQLSTFIHWYYWSCNLGRLVLIYVSAGVLGYYSSCTITLEETDDVYGYLHPYYFTISCTAVLIMGSLQLVSAVIGLCLLVYSKKHFNIDRTGEHPLKLIYNVLKYAWKHKCPENRSAFTYWEDDIPSRIDLGEKQVRRTMHH